MNRNRTYNRQSIRLKGYDYSSPGLYFITICTHNRIPIFGEVMNGVMHLNALGTIAHDEWLKTESIRDNVELDAFVIMPNHMHGIFTITSYPEVGSTRYDGHSDGTLKKIVGAYGYTPLQAMPHKSSRQKGTPPPLGRRPQQPMNLPANPQFKSPSKTVGAIVRGYKSAVTTQFGIHPANNYGSEIFMNISSGMKNRGTRSAIILPTILPNGKVTDSIPAIIFEACTNLLCKITASTPVDLPVISMKRAASPYT